MGTRSTYTNNSFVSGITRKSLPPIASVVWCIIDKADGDVITDALLVENIGVAPDSAIIVAIFFAQSSSYQEFDVKLLPSLLTRATPLAGESNLVTLRMPACSKS